MNNKSVNALKINNKSKGSGFSLLEILVAMAILSIIVMTLSTIFNQSSIAWDRGLSKSQKGMEGRAALNLMVTELKNAVASDVNLTGNTSFGGALMSFNTMGKAEKGKRLIQHVKYEKVGDILTRTVSVYNDDYSVLGAGTRADLIEVDDFDIEPIPAGPFTTTLPESITITIKIKGESSSGKVAAYSFGPNRKDDNWEKDDISTKERD